MTTDVSTLDALAVNVLRGLAMDGPQKANAGHPGTAMACAPIGWTLYSKTMRHNPANPHWHNRDRFILSAGHACILQYSLLHLCGYAISRDDLMKFRQWGSITPGHPEFFYHLEGDKPPAHYTPGIEITTGPLGQGFANGVGFACAEAFLAAKFNREGFPVVDHYVYALCSDGDLMEGVSQEAASLAGHLKLGKLIYFYDDNHITIEGDTQLAFTENVDQRFEAYGWHVQRLASPNDLEELEQAIARAQKDPRPSLISVRTHIAYPAPHAQDTAESHGAPLGPEEVAATKKILGLPTDQEFYIPSDVAQMTAAIKARGQKAEQEWSEMFARYRQQYPDLAREYEQWMRRELPAGWDKDLPEFPADPKGMATRESGGKVLTALARAVPNLIGGSADLAPSTKTLMDKSAFQSETPSGRNFHFGIREHAMAAMINGMVAHKGVFAFGATFFIFSDYLRPALRLAALSHIPNILVFTHDSIGLGEDGPTHQSIEQLPALRAMINCSVIRPCDANETREAWKAAMLHHTGPVLLVLSRQAVPTLDRTNLGAAEELHKGAYVLAEAEIAWGDGTQHGEPELILVASGTEVAVCLEARKLLQEQGIPTRVVSMPCWEFFEQQPVEYQEQIFPPKVKPRVAVEAAAGMGWERWIGRKGGQVCMTTYGASAPSKTNMEKFGFTAQKVVDEALSTRARWGMYEDPL
ncbi:MAG: transketolase [Candidatus Xenobia bacterium]